MKTTFAFSILLALSGAMALGDASKPGSPNTLTRRDDIKEVYKDLKDDDKIDKKGTILLTKSGIVSLGARPEIKTGDKSDSSTTKQLAKKDVDDADDIIKKFKKLREDKLHKPKRRMRRGADEGAICKKNGDCDDDQPMCAGVEGLAGPNICIKLDD
ncbi:hypothetical protein F4820DRAFT_352441 [Hypoxylon rubiginosum]|uniref:Uncharacterized protein n=1 Tax=Hypoxylon rubiginosum TaxID=110542 RepID=A0ACB9YYN9_9PEZI|nr:hypothetical protein F4820DRAFT_352441 [Hypoxylon rubiginosum]